MTEVHKYERIRDEIIAMTRASAPGSRIPTEKELAAKFGVSAMTVRRALQILTVQGLLEGVPGRGTFVANPRVTKLVNTSRSFSEALRSSGRRPGAQLVSAALRPAGDGVEIGFFPPACTDMVVELQRIRMADGVPIGFETAVLNGRLLPGLLGHDLSGSLYETIEKKYGLEVVRTRIVVSSRLPSSREATLLQVSPGIPCLQTVVTSRTQSGTNLERTISLFRGDVYEFAI